MENKNNHAKKKINLRGMPQIQLSKKFGFFLLAFVFLLAILASKWIQFQSNTILDTMPLHRSSVSVSETEAPKPKSATAG